jgi:apyrase
MADVFCYLRKNAPFIVRRENVRVIAGYTEGIFGWVSVALLLPPEHIVFSELGGALMQHAFAVDANSPQSEVYPIRIRSQTYDVFAHSFLGYGIDQAFDAVTRSIGNATAHPCLIRDLTYDADGCHYVGTGDYGEFQQLIQDVLLNGSDFTKVMIPLENEFVGVSVYAAVVADHGFPERLTMEEFLNRSIAVASLGGDQATHLRVDWGNVSFFGLFYVYEVVVHGFQLDPDTQCYFPRDINGTRVGYSIGALVCKIWDIQINDTGTISMWVSITVNALIVLFISILVLYPKPSEREQVPDGLLWVL